MSLTKEIKSYKIAYSCYVLLQLLFGWYWSVHADDFSVMKGDEYFQMFKIVSIAGFFFCLCVTRFSLPGILLAALIPLISICIAVIISFGIVMLLQTDSTAIDILLVCSTGAVATCLLHASGKSAGLIG